MIWKGNKVKCFLILCKTKRYWQMTYFATQTYGLRFVWETKKLVFVFFYKRKLINKWYERVTKSNVFSFCVKQKIFANDLLWNPNILFVNFMSSMSFVNRHYLVLFVLRWTGSVNSTSSGKMREYLMPTTRIYTRRIYTRVEGRNWIMSYIVIIELYININNIEFHDIFIFYCDNIFKIIIFYYIIFIFDFIIFIFDFFFFL